MIELFISLMFVWRKYLITVFFIPGLEVSLQSFLDNRSVQYHDSSNPLEQRQIEILIHTVDYDRLQLIPARIHRCLKKCFLFGLPSADTWGQLFKRSLARV